MSLKVLLQMVFLPPRCRAAIGELKVPHTLIVLCWNTEPCSVHTAMIPSSWSLVFLISKHPKIFFDLVIPMW